MIPFKLPQLSLSLTQYMEIAKLQGCASSCAGLLIGLGNKFFSSGIAEVDHSIIPIITERAPSGINSRVVPSYAILLWFTLEVNLYHSTSNVHMYSDIDYLLVLILTHSSLCYIYQILKATGLESDHREGLVDFVATEVLTVACELQSADSAAADQTNQEVLENFAKDLISSMAGMPREQVKVPEPMLWLIMSDY